MKRFFIFTIILISSFTVYAQTTEQLTENDFYEIRQRYVDVIKEFQFHLDEIGNHRLSKEIRQNALNTCLNLFVNKGECINSQPASYVHFIQDGKTKRKERIKTFLENYSLIGERYLKPYRLVPVDFDITGTNVEDCGDDMLRLGINVRQKLIMKNPNGTYNDYSSSESYLYIKKIEVDNSTIYKPLLTTVFLENIRQTK